MLRTIAVIGAGEADTRTMDLAREVGSLLAQRGYVVVTGGLGGVMSAACEGAKAAGGATVGILPGNDAADANAYVDIAVATGMGDARNAVIANTAAGFVAVGGAHGTLSEIAFACKRRKPVASLDSWDVDPQVGQLDTPAAAVEWLLNRV